MKKLLAALANQSKSEALVGLAFDFAVSQPVSTFVEPAQVLAHVERALDESLTEAALRQHVRPLLDRELARARARGDRVGDWLTAEALAELRSLAARPVVLKRSFLEGLVKQEAVAHLVRSVVEETLDRFLQTLKPGGSGGGVLGAMGRGAVGLASGFGKGILGGLGAQMEAQLKSAASAFIAGSMNVVMDRVVTILASPETGARLGRMNMSGFDEALKQKTSKVMEQVMKLPIDDLLDVVPGLLAHNLARPEIRAGILEELEAFLAIEGARTLKEILEASKGLEVWRAEVLSRGTPLLQNFATTEEFRGWLAAR